ncbi:CBN-NCX-6 protein [Aphelenchoides besseyi]|nr:CBN-NCX-6 protein [Aphelenchoides besseyi]KAI6193038.1 CBN-NCX-6 protein [Aphelenchoides besseyi]
MPVYRLQESPLLAGWLEAMFRNLTIIPSDDFDDSCVPYGSDKITWQEACGYVQDNYDACEGGGYIPWTAEVICQSTTYFQAIFVFLSMLWLIQLFILLAVSADSFLVNNIGSLIELMGISESVAGVTLIAFGNGSPDIFAAIASVVSDEKPKAGLAFGQLLGGGMFITAIVVPTVIMIRPLRLEPTSTLRNLGFYVLALLWLSCIMFTNNSLHIWGPVGFLIIYTVYASSVASTQMILRFQKWKKTKGMIFVRTANSQINSISQRLERRPTGSENGVLIVTTIQSQSIVKSFISHVVNFDLKKFKLASFYSKLLQILQAPCEIALRLSVPLASSPWNKPLAIVHVFVSPIALIYAFQLFEFCLYSLGASAVFAITLGIFTDLNREPRYYKNITAIFGFIVSIGWVYAVCSEVVNVVTMLGIISHLSPEILGVTIIGWTNSIGDLVADISLARQGYAQMAIAAGFGGPLFNLLVGFGLSFTIAELQGKDVEINIDQQKVIMFAFMCLSIFSSLILIVVQRFYVSKPYALYLYCVYLSFMVVLVLSESDLLMF